MAPPLDQPKLRRLVVKTGANAFELDGENISLNSPSIQDLITKVFAASGTDPTDLATEKGLTKDLAASATSLAKSVADNIPKP